MHTLNKEFKTITALECEKHGLSTESYFMVNSAKFQIAKRFEQFSNVEFSGIEITDNKEIVNISFGTVEFKKYYTFSFNATNEKNENVILNVYSTVACLVKETLFDVTFTEKKENEEVILQEVPNYAIMEYKKFESNEQPADEKTNENNSSIKLEKVASSKNETTKIDLTKTNFDYHKYDKKQVLTNDENTNNEVETMENKKLMVKVAGLYTENTGSRIRNVQIDVESSIIRKAFGVKNGEIDKAIQTPKKIENFNRKTVLTDKQITEKYMEYIEFFKWAKATDSNSRYDAEIKLEYFVKGVDFFNKSLAEKLKQIAINQ